MIDRDRYEELALKIQRGRANRREVMEYIELQTKILCGK